jgi:hypothetical protein
VRHGTHLHATLLIAIPVVAILAARTAALLYNILPSAIQRPVWDSFWAAWVILSTLRGDDFLRHLELDRVRSLPIPFWQLYVADAILSCCSAIPLILVGSAAWVAYLHSTSALGVLHVGLTTLLYVGIARHSVFILRLTAAGSLRAARAARWVGIFAAGIVVARILAAFVVWFHGAAIAGGPVRAVNGACRAIPALLALFVVLFFSEDLLQKTVLWRGVLIASPAGGDAFFAILRFHSGPFALSVAMAWLDTEPERAFAFPLGCLVRLRRAP